MLFNTHTYEPVRYVDYPNISSFANGTDLQFMVHNALVNPNR